ncbi:Flp family type IVb pilin [Shewanella sp. VB17]|nr:Flp family type IVb pilin [Shewanella sp. VB17]
MINTMKKKQRGAAAIEYAILAAAMSLIMFQFLGDEGTLTKAINDVYGNIVTKLETMNKEK